MTEENILLTQVRWDVPQWEIHDTNGKVYGIVTERSEEKETFIVSFYKLNGELGIAHFCKNRDEVVKAITDHLDYLDGEGSYVV